MDRLSLDAKCGYPTGEGVRGIESDGVDNAHSLEPRMPGSHWYSRFQDHQHHIAIRLRQQIAQELNALL